MEVSIRLNAYEQRFIEVANSGWGCGYVIIPKGHPFRVFELLEEDDRYFNIQVGGFSEEITYCAKEGENLVLGFDTAHSWNNIENSGKSEVERLTEDLRQCIESFTMEHAKAKVKKHIETLTQKYKDFL